MRFTMMATMTGKATFLVACAVALLGVLGASDTVMAQQVDLEVSKSDSADPVVVGSSFNYTVLVHNNDSVFNATGVVLTDNLPPEVSLVSTSGCLEDPSGVLTCNLGTITWLGTKVVTITVNANTAGVASNTASVSANESDPDLGNNSATENTTLNHPIPALSTPGVIIFVLLTTGGIFLIHRRRTSSMRA
jgi:uncharacterized repeat protein (TIGR01451 family)